LHGSELKVSQPLLIHFFTASIFNKKDKKDFVPKRENDLNILVKLLLDMKLLTSTNAVVKKHKVRDLFHRKKELMPSLRMSEVIL
jgi:hypothetical protein